MQGTNWNDLRVVLAVARTESFAQAARQLAVNETTVARRIARIERQLRARLFERGRSMLLPTRVGAVLIASAERVELEVQSAENAVTGADQLAAGSVRLTSVPILVNRVLVPALPRILDRHPLLKIELIAEPRDLSLTRRETDIALRMARPGNEMRVVTRRIGKLDYAVYARTGLPTEALPWISYDESMADLPQSRWIADRCSGGSESVSRLRLNDAQAVYESVRVGLGKSLLPVCAAAADNDLVRLDAGPAPLSRELWMMVHPQLRKLTRIRATIDWLVDIFDQLQSVAR